MAILIPSLPSCSLRMTQGERRLAERLFSKLDGQTLCWYDIPIGKEKRYPDFILFHPKQGMVLLEVKDWRLETILTLDKENVTLKTENSPTHTLNPLEQVRRYSYILVNLFKKDRHLVHPKGHAHQGQLLFPYGGGVVFSNITRAQFNHHKMGEIFPEHLVLCKDEMTEAVESNSFAERIWAMRSYSFGSPLTQRQIDRVRWNIFPEIRIETQTSLFDGIKNEEKSKEEEVAPDIIRVMDLQQEQLARGLGEGHRVVHGVAGSGKTMILLYRAQYLAQVVRRPILILCYNRILSLHIELQLREKGLDEKKVVVATFHSWCHKILKQYKIKLPPFSKQRDEYSRAVVAKVAESIESEAIPKGEYGAVLIDEAHDFEPEWLKIVAQMPHPRDQHLLILYDDAQSIYVEEKRRKFSFSSVGIKASGRTTILRINYRNPLQIAQTANAFAADLLLARDVGEDQIPLLHPECGGNQKIPPRLVHCNSPQNEAKEIILLMRQLSKRGAKWSEMAIIYRHKAVLDQLLPEMERAKIPFQTVEKMKKKGSTEERRNVVTTVTMHSSKGLEFPIVFIPSFGEYFEHHGTPEEEMRLHYVAITRSTGWLMMTYSKEGELTRAMQRVLDKG